MRKFKFIILTLIFYGAATLSAEVLQAINIEGLSKTRPSTVVNIIGYRVGDQISSASEDDIRQKLVKSGLFVNDSISVQLETIAGQTSLNIQLTDRFSLIPIPVFSYSDGSISGGLFVMESNLLGLGNQLFTGGLYSADYKMFLLGYTDSSFRGSDFNLRGNFGAFDDEVIVTSVDGDTDLVKYDQTKFKVGAGIEWDLNPFYIEMGEDLAYLSPSLSEDDIYLYETELQLKYDTLYYGSFFTKGIKTELRGALKNFSREFSFTRSVEAALSYQLILKDRWQFQLNGDAGVSRGDELQSLKLANGVCGSILPDDVLADSFVQGNLKMQIAAIDLSWGYLAFPLAYQAGWLDGISGDNEFFHGPAGGMAVFLKKVAFPAMSVQFAWNLETGTMVSSFNIGVRM